MITLNTSNARERCRTCLRKLLKNEVSTEDMFENIPVEGRINFVDINTYKGLREMIVKYVSIEGGEQELIQSREEYPRNVCVDCLRQLETFEMFRNKALDSAEKLYRVFNGFDIDLNENGLDSKYDIGEKLQSGGGGEAGDNDGDIFNVLFKDSLMETEAIMLDNQQSDYGYDMDPDPFQAASPQKHVKKRQRKLPQKRKSNTSPKKTKGKSKNEGKLLVKTKQEPRDDDEDANESDAGDGEYNDDPNNDLSDNEKLSKKVKRSKKKAKKSEKDLEDAEGDFDEDAGSDDDPDFNIESMKKTKKSKKSKETVNEDGTVIKVELDSDAVSSSTDSEPEAKEDTKSEFGPPQRKRRHRILNSGRKKGLGNSFKCDQCQHKFGHKITLDAHIRKVHQGVKRCYKCELCDKSYSFVGGLSTHIKSFHERKEDGYECHVIGCDKKYSNVLTLQRHMRIKHINMEDATQYVCEQCGATFNQSANLRYHMRTRHPTEEDIKRKESMPKERLECDICHKFFHSLYTLKYHKLRVHPCERKFECKVCGIRVAKKFMLISHMLVHSDQKMACKYCGREFVRKYQIEAHIRAVHHKLKPFQCPHCSESFASRKTLRHHIYIHTGEKPYVCDICGQAYRQPTCLKNHKKIHMKMSHNDATAAALAVNRSFLNNFLQTNEDDLEPQNGATN